MDELEEIVREFGVVSARVARDRKIHSMVLTRLVKKQGWQKLYRGVYAHPESRGDELKMRAALQWAGPNAVLSHRSAAAVYKLPGVKFEVELIVPRRQGPSARNTLVHRVALARDDSRDVGGLRVTSVERTLVDLAGILEEEPLAIAVEYAFFKGLTSLHRLKNHLDALGSGTRGLKLLRRVLQDCEVRGRVLESPLEVKVWRLFKASNLPLPTPQWEVLDGAHGKRRLDFAYRGCRVAVEAHSMEWHGSQKLSDQDCRRTTELAAVGWRTVFVTSADLLDPESVKRRIRDSLAFRVDPVARCA